jgi:2-succinyl-5-enolpyruvyl-6-hydroxy-3-cyclohexene-1-carboxylate synthase
MSEPTVNQRWAATLVGALVARGVRHVVVAPGSRSTPLALACAERADLRTWSVIDERSAAFMALGLARATGVPAAVLCTSGTAGAHFLPAVMEASEAGVPLVAITADRPWELHGYGAPQTIAQVGLFGRYVRAAEALPAPEGSPEALRHLAAVVARACELAQAPRRGPVHLNVPFREPLAPPTSAPGPVVDPVVTRVHEARALPTLDEVARAVAGARSGVIVCGPRDRDDGFGAAVHRLGERLGFPVLAEAASNARYGFPGAISFSDALLRNAAFAAAERPDVVLRFGGGLTPKGPQAWLDASGARLFVFSDDGLLFDPGHAAEAIVVGSVVETCERLLGARAAPAETRARWLAAQARLARALDGVPPVLTEPLVARELLRALPPGASVVLSSSMPIRAVEAFAPDAAPGVRVFTNRGVNGIDGVLSTAVGVAAGRRAPTALFIGDVALLHDLTGWLAARGAGVDLTVVLVNNDGGGIFHFLPVAERTAHFEALFGTPHGVDFAAVAALGGATLHRPADLATFGSTVRRCLEGGLHLVEVRTDRRANVGAHRELYARLSEALA